MKQFYIDEQYLTGVTEVREIGKKEIESNQDLVDAIRKTHIMTITSNKDHPEFTKLREQLGADGYIEIERGWWNGDRVLKPFMLNDFKFTRGAKFPCASAMNGHFTVARKYNYSKTIGY